MKTFFLWAPLAPPQPDRSHSPALARWADKAAVLFLGAGLVQVLFGFDEGWAQFIPMALGLLLFGLPHGAIDHLVALGLAEKPLRPAALSSVLFLYSTVVITVLACWLFFPSAAAIGFLIMTIYHWGNADLAFERYGLRGALESRGHLANGVHLILRGLIPIGLPFVFFPSEAFQFLNACVHLFAPNHEIPTSHGRSFVSAVFLLFFVSDLGLHLSRWRSSLARRIVVENFALVAFFYFVPPLIAVGWYFAGWHGLRHLLRLSRYESPEKPIVAPSRGISRLCCQAIPFTLASILILAGLYIWMSDRVAGAFETTALYLVLVSALTLPHLLVVEWMDIQEARLSKSQTLH